MCGRFGQTKKLIENNKESFLNQPEIIIENYNVSPGNLAYIISTDFQWKMATFGFTPHWEKQQKYYLNARCEGRNNMDNDSNFKDVYGIFEMPSFRESIRSNRCLIPVDYFIEGPEKEKLSRPYLIQQYNEEPFYLGGIYSDFIDRETGEIIPTFAIVTSSANSLLAKIGHHRSPLLINTSDIKIWLDKNSSRDKISDLFKPFNSQHFSAYRISDKIKAPNRNNSNNSISLREKIDDPIN